jgi:hypothetical protein
MKALEMFNGHERRGDSVFGGPVLLGRKVFDGDDVQRIERGDFSVDVQHRQSVAAKQDELGVTHRVFVPVRSAQAEWPKATRQSLPNAVHVHAPKLRVRRLSVNRDAIVASEYRNEFIRIIHLRLEFSLNVSA